MKMSQTEFNVMVGENLAKYRKFNKLTQIALAEKLNYSDKAVSKWESGESLPDVYVLSSIAKLYGVTVNDLLSPTKKPKSAPSKVNAFFVPALSSSIVWAVALIVFFALSIGMPQFSDKWIVFICALPITSIVFLVFACIYKMRVIQFITISAIIWTTILTFYLFFRWAENIITLYFIGIPLQVAFILWYARISVLSRKNKNNQKT